MRRDSLDASGKFTYKSCYREVSKKSTHSQIKGIEYNEDFMLPYLSGEYFLRILVRLRFGTRESRGDPEL